MKVNKVAIILIGILIVSFLGGCYAFLNSNLKVKKQINYEDTTSNEKELFEFALSKANSNKYSVNKVSWSTGTVAHQYVLNIDVDESFEKMTESDKFQTIHKIYDIFNPNDNDNPGIGRYMAGFMNYNGYIYSSDDIRRFDTIIFQTDEHQYKFERSLAKNYIDDKEIEFTDDFIFNDIKGELSKLDCVIKIPNSKTDTDTNSQNNTQPILEITKANIENTYSASSDYKDKNGNVIKSDWTNDDSCIKPNASQTITDTVKSTKDVDTFSAEIAEYN